MRRFGVLRPWWEVFEGRSGCGSSPFFVDPTVSTLFSFFLLILFPFGLCCDVCPNDGLYLVSVVAILM
jgi:hypothetical protein